MKRLEGSRGPAAILLAAPTRTPTASSGGRSGSTRHFVLCVITKEQKDQSWEPGNAGDRLLRKITALARARFEPGHPFPPALDGPAWP